LLAEPKHAIPTKPVAMSDIALGRVAQRSERLSGALGRAVPSLLFALRLWVSVCLALYVAFWLELDKPFWAGASAAIVCQPQLGASLRKGWFRLIGTMVGAVFSVVLTGFFPQDRLAYLGLLAMWGGVCAFGATVLRNFASYAAALAGYTAVIIAADTLGATGGPVRTCSGWRSTAPARSASGSSAPVSFSLEPISVVPSSG
jgi:Fusaric acid resistance protein family